MRFIHHKLSNLTGQFERTMVQIYLYHSCCGNGHGLKMFSSNHLRGKCLYPKESTQKNCFRYTNNYSIQ